MEIAEFEAGMLVNPELLNQIAAKMPDVVSKSLTEKGGRIVTTQDDYAKDRAEAIGQGTKTAHEAWERDLQAITGQKIPEGKKGLDWLSENKANIRYGASGDDTITTTRINNLTKENETLKSERDTALGRVTQAKVDARIESGISSLNFRVPADLTDENQRTAFMRDQVASNQVFFQSRYKGEELKDGSIVFKDSTGKAQLDKDGKPLTVQQIFATNHPYMIQPTGHQQGGTGGAGGGGQQQQQQQGGGDDFLGTTTEEIRAKLSQMGVAVGTNKWADLYDKAHVAAGYVKEGEEYKKKAA